MKIQPNDMSLHKRSPASHVQYSYQTTTDNPVSTTLAAPQSVYFNVASSFIRFELQSCCTFPCKNQIQPSSSLLSLPEK